VFASSSKASLQDLLDVDIILFNASFERIPGDVTTVVPLTIAGLLIGVSFSV
jgi:hypothetical protein